MTTGNSWFYGEPGGESHGPLPLDTIRAAVSAGRLSAEVVVSNTASGPWSPLRAVENHGADVLGAGGKKRERLAMEAQAKQQASVIIPMKSVSGFIEIVGYVLLGGGLLCILGFIAAYTKKEPTVVIFAVSALSNIVSGLLFIGAGEALRRLGEISAAVQKMAGKT